LRSAHDLVEHGLVGLEGTMNSIFSRIFVGIDDSEQAKAAVTLAARLAREHRGELVLCHAVQSMVPAGRSASGGATIDPVLDDASAKCAQAVLDAGAERAIPFGIIAERHMVEGDAANGILRVAGETGCGLIVIGTRHGVGVQQLLIGSVTNAVLRASTLPVLTVGRAVKFAEAGRRCFERIFVATDDSEPSQAAIETAFRLPPEDRRKLVFCSVADIDHGVDAERYAPETGDPTFGNRLTARAETIAGRASALAHARGVDAESRVLEGNPSEALIAAAVQERSDLIVIGSHGRRGIQRLLLGSIAETVVRTAPIPVLVVPVSVAVGITAKRGRKPSAV
jgi:nucleotide-binding universal stress UspA family protein